MAEVFDNLQLAQEARSTQDCERQRELADHPSALVLWNLVRNSALCEAARAIIGDTRVQDLMNLTEEAVRDVYGE